MDYFKKRGNMTSTEVESAGHHNRNDPKVVQSSSEARTAISNTGEDHAVVANNSDDIAADTTLPSAHNGQPSIADVELEGEDDVGHVEDETEEFERTAERVSLWKTKIQKNGVLPSKMVWAPYYRFRNQYFCARLCEISELDHFYQAVVQQPIRENEAVVEFISAPTTMAMDNQLVKAYKDKLIPYYGKGNPDSLGADALQSWDEGYTKKMHKVGPFACSLLRMRLTIHLSHPPDTDREVHQGRCGVHLLPGDAARQRVPQVSRLFHLQQCRDFAADRVRRWGLHLQGCARIRASCGAREAEASPAAGDVHRQRHQLGGGIAHLHAHPSPRPHGGYTGCPAGGAACRRLHPLCERGTLCAKLVNLADAMAP